MSKSLAKQLDRKSNVVLKEKGMLSVTHDFGLPERLIEEAMAVLLKARHKIAGVFEDDQLSLFPEFSENPKIPKELAGHIIQEARALLKSSSIDFEVEGDYLKIIGQYETEDVWGDLGYEK